MKNYYDPLVGARFLSLLGNKPRGRHFVVQTIDDAPPEVVAEAYDQEIERIGVKKWFRFVKELTKDLPHKEGNMSEKEKQDVLRVMNAYEDLGYTVTEVRYKDYIIECQPKDKENPCPYGSVGVIMRSCC